MITPDKIKTMQVGQKLKDEGKGAVPGLSLVRNRTGWSWMLYYRNREGVQRRPKIAPWPGASLPVARRIAGKAMLEVWTGGDPSAARRAARKDLTLDELWLRCEEDHYNRGKKWDAEARRIYFTLIRPILKGTTKLNDIGIAAAATLQGLLHDTPTQANRALSVLSKMMELAERWQTKARGTNPVMAGTMFQEKKRRRFASAEEIARLGEAMIAMGGLHVEGMAFFYLMFFTGARPEELLAAEPHMVQGDKLVWPAGKNGEERRIQLTEPALAVLRFLHTPTRNSGLCGVRKAPRKLWADLCRMAKIEGLWMRDLRRTFATVGLSKCQVSLGQLGELLGHASVQTTMVYAKLMEDEAQASAGRIASQVDSLLRGSAAPP